jgi:hypothetical protein
MNEISRQMCNQIIADRISAAEQATLALQFKRPRKWSLTRGLRATGLRTTFVRLTQHASRTTGGITQGTVVPR